MTGPEFINSGYGFPACTVCGCLIMPGYEKEHRAKCWPS